MDGMGQVDGWMDEMDLGNEKQMSQAPVGSYHGCFLLFANVSMVAVEEGDANGNGTGNGNGCKVWRGKETSS